MTILDAIREAGGRPIQRIAWVQAKPCHGDAPEWALAACPGGSLVVMPREAMRARYCITLDELLATDWRVVPTGCEGIIVAFIREMEVAGR